jgi:hypothetical protein
MSTVGDLSKFQRDEDLIVGRWSIEDVGDEVFGSLSFPFEFRINRPVRETWKYLKDFNLWMEDLQFSEVLGDCKEGAIVRLSVRDKEEHLEHYRKTYGIDPKTFHKFLIMKRVVPEKVIFKEELTLDRRSIAAYYNYAFNDLGAVTAVTGLMSYAPMWAPKVNKEDLRAAGNRSATEIPERWKTSYIPRLRQLVESH